MKHNGPEEVLTEVPDEVLTGPMKYSRSPLSGAPPPSREGAWFTTPPTTSLLRPDDYSKVGPGDFP